MRFESIWAATLKDSARTVDGSACIYVDCVRTVSRLSAASKLVYGLYSLCMNSMWALYAHIGAVWAVCESL